MTVVTDPSDTIPLFLLALHDANLLSTFDVV